MPRPAVGPAFTLLCLLTGLLWGGPGAAARPDEKPTGTVDALRQLRKPVHEWLARDIGEKTLTVNRAYADLILAFGLARAGEPDEAKKLVREAAVILEKGDVAHQCLLSLYRHRIEQILASKPPTDPLPTKLLTTVIPTGNEPVNASIKLHHYIVLRARELSRIVDPVEQVDPYLPWTANGADDPLVRRLAPLQDETDPARFGPAADKLLKDTAAGSVETRLRVTTRLAALAPRAGDAFGVEVLKSVPELVRTGRRADGEPARAGTTALVEQSLALATILKKPELFKPLLAEAVELIGTERGTSATGTIARLTVRCEQGIRIMRLEDAAKTFLKETAGKLPEATDPAAIRLAAGKSWPDAARTRLAEAGVRRVAGQGAEADKLFALVRGAVFDPPADERGISYYRLVAEHAAACGRLAPAEAKRALEELFTKLAKVPDTYTTATHYSRYHLMILEAAVLGLAPGDF